MDKSFREVFHEYIAMVREGKIKSEHNVLKSYILASNATPSPESDFEEVERIFDFARKLDLEEKDVLLVWILILREIKK